MLNKVLSFFANRLNLILKNPFFRYRIVVPFIKLVEPDPDEKILEKAMNFIAHHRTQGDYLEFGVWKGRSFLKAYNVWKYFFRRKCFLKSMKFYAFDSFEGLPEITGEVDKDSEFKKGDYFFSLENFKKVLKKGRVNMNDVVIVPGWYKEVLNKKTKDKLNIKTAAIVFIDCDLYESAVEVLNFITDLIRDGTILIFDDWFAFKGSPDKGEQRAVGEWLKTNPRISLIEWQNVNWRGKSFIVNIKP